LTQDIEKADIPGGRGTGQIIQNRLKFNSMNAARVCKLRNGVNKTHQFLLFSMAKG
jgi:hypothetical protein